MGLLSGMRNFDGAFTQEIGKRNIKYGFQSPELMCFGDFVWFLYKCRILGIRNYSGDKSS